MTKTINEMSLDELAEYVVTLDGWEWRLASGIKTQEGLRLALWSSNDVFIAGPDDENNWNEGQVVGVSTLGSYIDDYYIHERIDLNDNATCGCLLAMVRKRLGEHVTSMKRLQGWNVVEYIRLEAIHLAYSYDTWGFMPLLAGEYRTEAHALVAALTKEGE